MDLIPSVSIKVILIPWKETTGAFEEIYVFARKHPSAVVYLTIGVLPFEAQRDIEILGLLGQIAVCPSDQQSVKDVIFHNLTFYGNNLKGWGSLVRHVCHKYDLPDPLQYMSNPWRADRWRGHCSQTVSRYWVEKLRSEAAAMDSLEHLDIESLNLDMPMNTWIQAGLNSEQSKKATVVSWMLLGVFKTRKRLFVMKKTKGDKCLACDENKTENLSHLLLSCPFYESIREEYLPRLAILNKNFSEIIKEEKNIIISILDPDSTLLPPQARLHCEEAFNISRSYCYDVYRKREKFYENN